MTETQPAMPEIVDFRPFVICTPSNYATSKNFYADLGFTKLWDDGKSACEFATGFGSQRFLVTLHFDIEPPQHAMLHCWVEDARRWFDYMETLGLSKRYTMVTITPPVATPWGWLITYVADPAGVKWHFAEPHAESNKEFFNNAGWMH